MQVESVPVKRWIQSAKVTATDAAKGLLSGDHGVYRGGILLSFTCGAYVRNCLQVMNP